MNIIEIYEKYRIMPNLQLHQLRVAAVGKMIAEARADADAELVVSTGLVHDMGNILKADFSVFPPEFYGARGLPYWIAVKADYENAYGKDEHYATAAIAQEIGVTSRAIDLIGRLGFSKAKQIQVGIDINLKICEYADQRVAPRRVTSLAERLRGGRERYMHRADSPYSSEKEIYEENSAALFAIEEELFTGLSLHPGDITEESVQPLIQELRAYDVA